MREPLLRTVLTMYTFKLNHWDRNYEVRTLFFFILSKLEIRLLFFISFGLFNVRHLRVHYPAERLKFQHEKTRARIKDQTLAVIVITHNLKTRNLNLIMHFMELLEVNSKLTHLHFICINKKLYEITIHWSFDTWNW